MWLTSGRISHEAVYADRRPARGPAPAPRAGLRAGAGPCTLVVRDHGIYQRRSRRIYVNALSPAIAGERVGVEGWGGNGHLLEAYSTKPTCKPQSTMCSF